MYFFIFISYSTFKAPDWQLKLTATINTEAIANINSKI